MEVLVCLAASSGRLVERDEILKQVWGRPAAEEVLTRCISELRHTLADDRARPKYIQTVPKRGYRLLLPVVPKAAAGETQDERDPTQTSPPQAPPPPSAALASVAVLPFENHSPDGALRYVADGFAAELHNTLARVDRLRVVSRRSSFALRDSDVRHIGRELDVHYVISGSLQLVGMDLRIIAQLDETDTGTQLWSRAYDRKSKDILAVEREIAEAVVGSFATQQQLAALRAARRAPTSNLDAWGLVQKSRAIALENTTSALAEAIEPLQHAIALDPDYAAAHATLGSLLVERLINGLSQTPENDEQAACAAARKAMALAPQDPFILKMVGLVWAYCGDLPRSASCLRKAVALAPFDPGAWGYLGWPLAATGAIEDLDELDRILDRLLTLEPQHPGTPFWLYHRSVAHTCRANYDAASIAIEAALERQPASALGWMHYANVLGHQNKKQEAKEALARCRECNPAMTVSHFDTVIRKLSSDDRVIEARTGGLYAISGRTEK